MFDYIVNPVVYKTMRRTLGVLVGLRGAASCLSAALFLAGELRMAFNFNRNQNEK